MTIEGKADELKAARDVLAGALVDSGWDKPDTLFTFSKTGTGAV
jgi:hypothetical protein